MIDLNFEDEEEADIRSIGCIESMWTSTITPP
jgi:hypothetical protein